MKMTFPLKSLSVVLGFLVLLGVVFGLGYWEGQRGLRQETNAVANPGVGSVPGNNLARYYPAHPVIPPNASPEMKEFLQNQAALSDKMEQLRKQSPTGELSPQQFIQFRQQNADLIKRQSQLAQIVAQQESKNTIVAPATRVPPNASPQLKAYLAARDQLIQDQIAFMNQHRTDSFTVQQTAMKQWRQQNASRFQQLQQLAQALNPAQNAGSKD
ncbi:MAG TPA: hypothetical protein VL981_13520 [Candidatus Methylacidiphilales bacterium]|nr:hypothetical protein [Candidatus Methylacidiphilales bacterium]